MTEDEKRVREIIRDNLRRWSYDLDNTEHAIKYIMDQLDAENFKIVKRMSIGGRIG